MTAQRWSARGPVLIGSIGIAILVVGLGGWSVTTRIEGAVVAPGTVQVETFRQVVQHPDGGIVAELAVREGDRVRSGDVLMRFDDTKPRSERAIIAGQLDEVSARMARLAAERDGMQDVAFPPALTSRAASEPAVLELMNGQLRLFEARAGSLRKQLEQLDERANQYANQIEGLKAQLDAVRIQIGIAADELKDQEDLLVKGLTQSSRVTALRREAANLQGRTGELEAAIAQTSGQIAETRIERLRLESARREEAITTLRDIGVRASELRERLVAIDDTLSRLDLRAPSDGIVYGLTVHTLQAVVRAADPVLYIVPEASRLVVQVQVPTVHIDQVHKGQAARLNLSAFDQRTTPSIEGTVTKVSPDAFTDEKTGATFYRAEITPDPGALDALKHVTLIPGMPAEAFIKTEPRTPLSYLVKPMTDYFARAFREG